MKIINITILLLVSVLSCAQENRELQSVNETVNLYLDTSLHHTFSDGYNTGVYRKNVFHPDINELETADFSSIKEELPKYSGYNLVKSFEVNEIFFTHEKVIHDELPEDRTYFVKVKYKAVAVSNKKKFSVLKNAIDVYEYLILAKDKGDSRFKIVDSYPDHSAHFVDLDYAKEKASILARITNTGSAADFLKLIENIK